MQFIKSKSVSVGLVFASLASPAANLSDLRLDEVRALLASAAGTSSLEVSDQIDGETVRTTRYQHFYKGLPVIGSQVMKHIGPAGEQITDRLSRFDLSTTAKIVPREALILSMAAAPGQRAEAMPELQILPNPESDSARLVYVTHLRGEGDLPGREMYLDAHSGQWVAQASNHLEILPMNRISQIRPLPPGMRRRPLLPGARPGTNQLPSIIVRTADKQGFLIDPSQSGNPDPKDPRLAQACQVVILDSRNGEGEPVMMRPEACPIAIQNGNRTQWADEQAELAQRNAMRVATYFMREHKRNSFDGAGSPIVEIVHIGKKFSNAFWNSENNTMSYGDGDPAKGYADFARALDVAGHEMTHGVVDHSAHLLGWGESGALNEAYADFFGIMVATQGRDWTIGREVFANPTAASGIRDLQNPARLGYRVERKTPTSGKIPYPSHIQQLIGPTNPQPACSDENDYCRVHGNATIPGHASYLVSQAIGPQAAGKLYYLTLTQYLNQGSTIRAAAAATKQACTQLLDAPTCAKVHGAFAQVGL